MIEVNFGKDIGTVKVYAKLLGKGCSRDCHTCNYTKDGKEYVVKQAINNRGYMNNRFEYQIYQHAQHTPNGKYYPDIPAMSKRGRFLLIERCVIAMKAHQYDKKYKYIPMYNRKYFIRDMANKIFPEFMVHDMNERNWGYTLQDNRPVIIDFGFDADQLSSTAFTLGIPQEKVNDLSEY